MKLNNASVSPTLPIQGGSTGATLSGATWLASKPPNPKTGDCYYDQTSFKSFMYDGINWLELIAGSGSGGDADFVDPPEKEMLARVLAVLCTKITDQPLEKAKEMADSYVFKSHEDEDYVVLEEFLGIGTLLEDLR